MKRTIVLLSTMALTLLVASGVALATAIGSAQAANKVVGPGESIQKAVYAADPGWKHLEPLASPESDEDRF
jgi:hypothetical protein